MNIQNISRLSDNAIKRTNQDVLIEYLISDEGSIVLNERQAELLVKINMADDLIRSRRYKINEIARILRKRWGISVATSLRIIEDARFIYASTRKSSKKYLLAVHIERMEDLFYMLKEEGQSELLIKLFAEITKAIKELPEDSLQKIAPAAIIFNISQNNINLLTANPLTEDQAKTVAIERLKIKGINPEEYL